MTTTAKIARFICWWRGHVTHWVHASDRLIWPGQPYMAVEVCQSCGKRGDLRICVDGQPLFEGDDDAEHRPL